MVSLPPHLSPLKQMETLRREVAIPRGRELLASEDEVAWTKLSTQAWLLPHSLPRDHTLCPGLFLHKCLAHFFPYETDWRKHSDEW